MRTPFDDCICGGVGGSGTVGGGAGNGILGGGPGTDMPDDVGACGGGRSIFGGVSGRGTFGGRFGNGRFGGGTGGGRPTAVTLRLGVKDFCSACACACALDEPGPETIG
jgi:hypothetical protein